MENKKRLIDVNYALQQIEVGENENGGQFKTDSSHIRVMYKISPCKSCACCSTCDIFNTVGPKAISRCDYYTPIVEVGQWIEKLHEDARGDYHLWHCSRCDNPSARKRNFCAECGTKMEVEVAHGRWLDIQFDPMWRTMLATCSHCRVRGEVRVKSNECGFAVPDFGHCPHCGAKMDEEEPKNE